MRTPSLVALALAGALALPAWAQDSSSQPQTPPPAASSQQQSQPSTPVPDQSTSAPAQQADQNAASSAAQADQNAQKAGDLKPLTQSHEGFWGHLNPFARKKYVKRQIAPVQDRLNELDELTASNSKLVKDVDARATEGIRLASAKANDADQHAVDAGNRATAAQQLASQASTRLDTVQKTVSNIDQYQTASQVEIRFKPGQQALSRKAKDALDQMATPLKDQRGYIIEVQSFSAGSGQAAIASSNVMADSVVRHLVIENNIPVYRIYKVGMGNAPITGEDGKAQRVRGGRVEISLLKNGAGDLSTEPTTAGGSSNAAAPLPQSDQGASSYSGAKSQPAAQQPQTTPAPQQTSPQPQQQSTPPQPQR